MKIEGTCQMLLSYVLLLPDKLRSGIRKMKGGGT
ncbi:unnamed protein product [Rhodiola kirilowii]